MLWASGWFPPRLAGLDIALGVRAACRGHGGRITARLGQDRLTLQVVAEMQNKAAPARLSTPSTPLDTSYAENWASAVRPADQPSPTPGERSPWIVDSLVRSGAVDPDHRGLGGKALTPRPKSKARWATRCPPAGAA